jgi:hypothetical protein
MGQKANTLTLKKKLFSNIGVYNPKLVLPTWQLLNLIARLLTFKKILLTEYTVQADAGLIKLNLSLYYTTLKGTFYRDILEETNLVLTKNKVYFYNKALNRLLRYYSRLYKFNTFFFNITNLNFFLKGFQKQMKSLYSLFSRFISTLFVRRFNLYLDFIKLTVLFCHNLIPLQAYITIWAKIFQFLTKRSHTQFFNFTKTVFDYLTNFEASKISGIKFLIKGRIKGKDRATSMLIKVGKLPLQGFKTTIDYSSIHVYTLYGAYGIKIWTSRY